MALRKPLWMDTDGSHEEMAAADSLELGGLAMVSGGRITGLLTPTSDDEAANKAYVDAVAQALVIKDSVVLKATGNVTLTGAQTIDGVAVADGDRVACFNQTTSTEDGIYVASTTGAWTRATDLPSGAHAAGVFFFVEEGTVNADSGWVCTNDNPTDVVGTDDLVLTQFSGAGQVIAGAGLTKTGNQLDVGAGDGIAVAADTVAVDLATDPGLEFASAKLRAKVYASGGVQRTANGLELLINDSPDTLDVDASGLKVTGVPSLFKVNGTAVGATVTATALTDLTDGGNADTYHVHAVGAATEAPKVENTIAVSEAVAAGDPVYQSTTNDRVGKSDAATKNKAKRVVGIARTGQSTPGSTAEVVSAGPCAGVLSGATAGDIYYLAAGGGVTATPPGGGNWLVVIGYAMNASDLFVRIQEYGKKAA